MQNNRLSDDNRHNTRGPSTSRSSGCFISGFDMGIALPVVSVDPLSRLNVTTMCPFRLLAVIFLQAVTLAEGLNTTTFTLYTTPVVNWQTAVTFCRGQGQDLVRVRSQEEHDFLTTTGQNGHLWSKRSFVDTWSSLYDPDPGTPGGGYHWQLATDCPPLHPTHHWTHWDRGQPSNGHVDLCVKLTRSVSSGYVWGTANCESVFQMVICRAEKGLCDIYEQFVGYSITLLSEDAQIIQTVEVTTEDGCRQACTRVRSVNTTGCYAAQWTTGLLAVSGDSSVTSSLTVTRLEQKEDPVSTSVITSTAGAPQSSEGEGRQTDTLQGKTSTPTATLSHRTVYTSSVISKSQACGVLFQA
ncbi:hypothetical protein ACOMHN_014345 [Nucella lapillus]